MTTINDAAIFAAVIQQGGFSHAAKHLGLSAGLVSRKITQLESVLGVSLMKRTTRRLELTAEGELFYTYAQRIQEDLETAINLIQASAKKPKGTIRISAPSYFGRHYLTPILMDFSNNFPDIKIELLLSNQKLDLIKEQLDLVIRGSGYLEDNALKDSNMKMKLLYREKIGLYANADYLLKQGEPKTPNDLAQSSIINYLEDASSKSQTAWSYWDHDDKKTTLITSKFSTNDIESGLNLCQFGYGIGKFTDLNVKNLFHNKKVVPILTNYSWGEYYLYILYSQQKSLPTRTRLLLDFIETQLKKL